LATDTTVRPVGPAERRRSGTIAALEVVAGTSRGKVFELTRAQTVIGKGDVDVRLGDSGVSRHHAKIVRAADGSLTIVDLASTNGTLVNDAQIDVALLREGDRIHIGPDAILQLCFLDDAPAVGPVPLDLSDRQLEVARLVAGGMTNADIAKRLGISPRTVASHLDHIYTRLGLRSRAALTRWLADAGLLGDPGP
jgi:DNA-binding CsgD family transcriptional regulator